MIDTEHVKCDTCTAPEPMEFDASDEASRGWPTVDIETNPYKAQFPLFQQHPEIAFLDSAATAQRPACVLDAERDFYQRMNANPLRGLYSLSVEATDAIAKVRQQIADLIGASQANEVVFTRNTSESLNLVAKSFAPTVLEPGDEVVITIMEHHSNLIPWQQVCRETGAKLVYLYPTKTGQLTTEEVLAKVGPKTKILAVGQVSNVLGVENPVKNLGKLVHKYGGYLVVDGAQSLPHMPVDVADLGADFFAFSAHKAMGPMASACCGQDGPAQRHAAHAHRRRDDRLCYRAGRRLGARSREIRGRHTGRRRHLRHGCGTRLPGQHGGLRETSRHASRHSSTT